MLSIFKNKIIIDDIKYIIKNQIGEGAFSYIYRVKNDKTNNTNKTNKKEYAIKKTICQTDEQKTMAMKEIIILNEIQHKNILQIISSDLILGSNKSRTKETNNMNIYDVIYIVMPLYELGTLQHIIDHGVYYTNNNNKNNNKSGKSGILSNVAGFTQRSVLIKCSISNILIGCAEGLLAIHNAGYRHAGMIV